MNITCSACQKMLRIPDSAAGKKVRCPACQAVFLTPATIVTPDPIPVAKLLSPETAIAAPPSVPSPLRIAPTRSAVEGGHEDDDPTGRRRRRDRWRDGDSDDY